MTKIKAWYNFAYRAWIALGIGWSALIISITPYLNLRLDRAGAILVCGAIVADVFHDKRYRLFVEQVKPGITTSYMYEEVDVPGETRKGIKITQHQMKSGATVVNTNQWTLYALANQKEFRVSDNTRTWDIKSTMNRVERRVDYAIVVSAIAGALFWAFAT